MIDRALRWAAPGYALALTLLVLAPALPPGYLLLRDAVSTPRSYLTDAALGLSESAPRAAPQDFAVALASTLVDGGVVVKALLVAGLWSAGCGAARLVGVVLPRAGLPGQLVAVTVAIWNPYVAERLLQGHWSLLVGYGCLPWVAATMLGLRSAADRIGKPMLLTLVFWLALAGLTPTGLLLATAVALVCAVSAGSGWPRRFCVAVAVAAAAVAALPWLVTFLLGPSQQLAGAPGVDEFAARAEPGLGTAGSLAGLGGLWNSEAVPGSRATFFALPATLVLLTVVTLGLPVVVRRIAAVPLLALAVTAVTASAALATGTGLNLLHTVVDAAPGLGVLRDGQKWVALAVPGYALSGGGAVLTLRRWLRPPSAALVCCAALILALPDLAWGVGGRISPVHYPHGWQVVSTAINAEPRTVVVLPAGSMRRFDWAGSAPVLDPLPRWLRADVLTTGDLVVAGRTVPGEGTHARAVEALLLAGSDTAALTGAGVGWVVVEAGTDGEFGAAEDTLHRLTATYRDADLRLYRAGGDTPGAPAVRRWAAVTVHLGWLAMLAAGAAGIAFRFVERQRLRQQAAQRAADAPSP